MKKYKKEPNPDKPLTQKEWDAMGPIMYGLKDLPKAAQKAFKGRPKAEHTKTQVTLRIDEDIIDKFRSTGVGWQTRINSVLKEYWANT